MTSAVIKNIGFPIMDKEQEEKRDFLPVFFRKLKQYNCDCFLEKGYGEKLGYTEEDYLEQNDRIVFAEREEVFKQDLIIVIRVPEFESLDLIKPHAGLLSMLHYETRPLLLNKLKEQKIHSFSLDGIVDDKNQRMMVTYEMTALGGIYTSFPGIK
ncbi:hypothetical protein LC040_10155 [Bacillus tianshenii]|nr:hypothetical protein LC040_10155 [Bacillus tianshenii]